MVITIQETPVICMITTANTSLATLALRTFAHLNLVAHVYTSVSTVLTLELDNLLVLGTLMDLTIQNWMIFKMIFVTLIKASCASKNVKEVIRIIISIQA